MKGKRPTAHTGPKCTQPVGDPPGWIPESGKEEWKRVVSLLREMGSDVSALHRASLIGYCVAHSTIEAATEELERDGITLTSTMGDPRRHPASVTQVQALTQMRNYMVELGLTPGSAGKIQTNKAEHQKRFSVL